MNKINMSERYMLPNAFSIIAKKVVSILKAQRITPEVGAKKLYTMYQPDSVYFRCLTF